MAYSVLILDDDADFNSLLTDIFEQADYVVTSLLDPVEAIQVFRDTHYDMVVTDHRMPGMTGTDFMKVLKELKPQVPVIMVSGYLENDTIRELIAADVGGVFLKPLNIFSLLERTSELIENAKRLQQEAITEASAVDHRESTDGNTKLGFTFRSFPCESPNSIKFAERLHRLRNFKSTLSLIGEPGTQFRLICEDLRGLCPCEDDHFIYFNAESFETESVLARLSELKAAGAYRVTCVLIGVELMGTEQKRLAALLPRCRGVFDSIDIPLRTIFCVSGDLDSLFDSGQINEDLYIHMGTAEVSVPALRDCPSDIVILAQQIVDEIIRDEGGEQPPLFQASAKDFMRRYSWERNYEQLFSTIHHMLELNRGSALTLEALNAALQVSLAVSPRARFEVSLLRARVDYVRAVSVLLDEDLLNVSAFFNADAILVEAAIK